MALFLSLGVGPPARALPACGVDPSSVASGKTRLIVKVDPSSTWRAEGEDVKFTVAGPDFSLSTATVAACFRWANNASANNKWVQSPTVRLVDASKPSEPVFEATTPQLPPAPDNLWLKLLRKSQGGETEALGLVPDADFQVVVSGAAGSTPVTVTQPIGVTNEPLAVAVAVIVVIVAWAALFAFGRWRGVPGGWDPVLQVISTKSGYASLSQLQILLWSFVIGASAVYVMVLSGNLIEISGGTLTLLGISGGAAVASKLQSVQQSRADPKAGPLPARPGAVTTLQLNCTLGATDVGLTWGRPTTGGPIDTFTVRYRTAAVGAGQPGDWTTATSTLAEPGIRVAGLTAGTAYEFQVYGTNAAGDGPMTDPPLGAVTAAAPGGPAVAGLCPGADVKNRSIAIGWQGAASVQSYRIQWRAIESAGAWRQRDVSAPRNAAPVAATLPALDANTAYYVRVAAADPAQAEGFGPWSTLTVSTIGPREPLWSDLVVENDGAQEIEVTRVQMLFFTVIVAFFVLVRVINSEAIPPIPDSYLLLMGISNGVYLTAKYIN
jgi:hypothetical protein